MGIWDGIGPTLHIAYGYARTCDYLGVCISYVAGLKLRNYSWGGCVSERCKVVSGEDNAVA